MFRLTSRIATLATVVLVTAALGTGCGNKTSNNTPTTSNAKIAVSSAAIQSDIGSIQLTITAAPGTGAGFPITAFLTKAPAGNVWTGDISQIPASTAGDQRTFDASAFSGPGGTGTKLYEGSTIATVIAGQTAQVTIILQELNVQPGPTNYAPVITAVTSTAALLLPGQGGTFSVSAYDPDDPSHFNRPQFNGEPLAYKWGASCTNGGTLTFGSATSSTTTFTAPSVSSICTISVTVSETALQNNSSVTTYFTIQVNANFGNAQIFAFPNSAPIVTVRGDFRYNFFADVGTIPVGQQGDLFFHAIDPDGDGVRFALSAKCGTGFDATGALINPADIGANQFSATTSVFTGGPVVPPAPQSYEFDPTFGYPVPPVAAFTDPTKSCSFRIDVFDLCTAGDCGPAGSQGSKPDGADRGGQTTGFLNATAPSQPQRAPTIVRVTVPNQDGASITGAQTWDPQKFVVVQPGQTYNLAVDAEDTYAAGPLSISANCNVGTATPVDTILADPKHLHFDGTWTAPATLVTDMNCAYTVTSAASGLSTVATIRFASSDPCVGLADGTDCTSLQSNKCVTAATCQAHVCTPTTTTTCTASDQCHNVGTCDPNTGVCSNPNASNGTACNADSNGCTVGDSCQAGVCVAGPAQVCNTPPNGFCYAANSGACVSTGNNSNSCAYTASTGQACAAANATVKCSGANVFTSFSCDNTGACVGQTPVACTSSQCTTGGSCSPNTGACAGGNNQPDGTPCNDGNACTTGDQCTGGICAGVALCPSSEICKPGGTCEASVVAPQKVRDLQVSPPPGLTIDSSGNTYVASAIFSLTPIDFDGHPVVSTGDADIFLARYNTGGTADWAIGIGDAQSNAQIAIADAVTQDGTLVAIGNFAGNVTVGSSTISSASQIDFLIGVSSATGAGKFAKQFNNGANGQLFSVGANPKSATNRVAVCGKAVALSDLAAPGDTLNGASDLVIGVFDSGGNKIWSQQLGGSGNDECDAVVVDDNGDVYASGQFDSPTLTLPGAPPLTGPGTTTRKFLWVAKFAGGGDGTGKAKALLAQVYNGPAGQILPAGIAVDSTGAATVVGGFTGSIAFGGTTLTSAGGQDAFVAKLNAAALSSVWAVRLGGSGPDSANGVGIDSFGDVIVTGGFQKTTTGAAALTAAGTTASDVFILKLNGVNGNTDFAAGYGDTATQTGDAIAVNRWGSGADLDLVSVGGTLNSTITFPAPAGPVTATGATDTFLLLSNLTFP